MKDTQSCLRQNHLTVTSTCGPWSFEFSSYTTCHWRNELRLLLQHYAVVLIFRLPRDSLKEPRRIWHDETARREPSRWQASIQPLNHWHTIVSLLVWCLYATNVSLNKTFMVGGLQLKTSSGLLLAASIPSLAQTAIKMIDKRGQKPKSYHFQVKLGLFK